ncbi:MAG: glycosyltransferase family 4 protein [Opitutaceae bacterium]
MRIAFLASEFLDPDTPRSWSGLPFFMRHAIESAGIETVTLSPVDTRQAERLVRFLYWRWMRGRRYLKYCDHALLKSHARQYERGLAGIAVDAVFSPSTWPLAYLETDLPTVFWTDACFAGLLDFYHSFTDIAPPSVTAGHVIEQLALDRCARALYSTDWAAGTTQRHYVIPESKVSVVPFGGNLLEPPSLQEATQMVRERPLTPCRLLLVGVDWKRKGVDIAVDAVKALSAAGLDCRLTIVGCSPPAGRSLPACVDVIPFISKVTSEDRQRLNEIYARSHFFVMPTRAEAFGVVFAEASAFGVPCLATAVGGLPSVVKNGVNGQLFPLNANGDDYADWILNLLKTPARYQEFALRAAQHAAAHLSWKVAGQQVATILKDVVAKWPVDAARRRTAETTRV